ncbi:MAG: orotidine-5'-phosphate decarboxylase [Pseudomonadota bacterium]
MAELVIALDAPKAEVALAMAKRVAGYRDFMPENAAEAAPWMKVGLELFTGTGPSIVKELKSMGFKVFLDMKFHDIPNTVQGAVRSAVATGADMINIHLQGGERMARAAVQGLKEGADLHREKGSAMPLLFGVTILTSTAQGELIGYDGDISALAAMLAKGGSEWGLDGVVCSGFEVGAIKAACGEDFKCLTPGIRPAKKDGVADDQRRVMTPQEAVQAGSDYLVVGRPITGAENPAKATAEILLAMSDA